ncbi:MAG TPA: Erv1/Alr family FAD-linked sulfhydryl oxidase [Tepidisphaeraceae bacterium]|nr:Erv1/Alr family FAD-linked sulfhydryl oxidase [Tepidisphaeraceae bacterium]
MPAWRGAPRVVTPLKTQVKQPWVERGPMMWKELHDRPNLPLEIERERAWLTAFAGRLDCGDCRQHWLSLLTVDPPDLSSPAAYARWGVRMHNAVNLRLGKPEMSFEDAADRWGWGRS